jgi:hypothetical protein
MGYFTDLISGQPFGSSAKAQALSDSLDSQIAAQNKAALDSGVWDEDQYNQAMADLAASGQDVTGEIDTAFVDGAADGAKAEVKLVTQTIPDAVNATLWATVKAFFRAIPLSVWGIAIVVLFFWMGGATFLKGRLARK